MMSNKIKEYRICKERGHSPGNMMRGDGYRLCKFCDTYYRYDQVLSESGAPKEEEDGV
jgi:hypothetical protein